MDSNIDPQDSDSLALAAAGSLSWTLLCSEDRLFCSQALTRRLAPAEPETLAALCALLDADSARQLLRSIESLRTEVAQRSLLLRFKTGPETCVCRLESLGRDEQICLIQAQLTVAGFGSESNSQAQGAVSASQGQVHGVSIGRPELRGLQQARETIFNQLAHDLRNALSSVGGFSQLLRRRKLISGDAESLVDRIQQAAENAHQLLQEMFFARELSLSQTRPEVLETLVQDALRWVGIQSREKGLRFFSEVAPGLPASVIPPAVFERLLKQVLTNALKFTPAGGEIRLSVDAVDKVVRLRITDTAPTIPPELRAHLFDKVMLREQRAGGMELYLARQIVENFGGRIWFSAESGKSDAKASGNTFYLELPAA